MTQNEKKAKNAKVCFINQGYIVALTKGEENRIELK